MPKPTALQKQTNQCAVRERGSELLWQSYLHETMGYFQGMHLKFEFVCMGVIMLMSTLFVWAFRLHTLLDYCCCWLSPL